MDGAIVLHEFETLDSTNRLLLEMAASGSPCGTAVLARRQTGGRGRLGRSFSSPEGGIYVSILVPLSGPEENTSGIFVTAKAGVAVRRTVKEVCGKDCSIKWVNDIIYEGKKVCGILAQGCGDKAVVGIGINYRTDMTLLPPDVQAIASSLYGPQEKAPSAREFTERLLDNVWALCAGKEDENWLAEYKSSSTIVGKKVKIIQAGSVTGTGIATGIDGFCRLHVTDDTGRETVLSTGEVTIRED